MDNQNSAVADIPDFKLAKVGKDRERKRGGAGWLGGQGAGPSFGGALGNSLAGGGGFLGTGMSMARALVMLLVAGGVSAGAWMLGSGLSGNSASASKTGPKFFSDKETPKYSDTANVIKADNSIPNSLGYVTGSRDGLTPEERAKKAADAEAARKAAEDAKNKADADAAATAAAAPAAAPEPAAVAAEVPKKGLTAGKFGQMNSSFGGGGGGGLSGGSGLSGGINRNFGSVSGLGNGIKPKNGALSAFHATGRPGMSSVAHSANGKSKSQGFAKQQLDNAFAQSRKATAGGASETSAAEAAQPFDNNPALGSTIDGPGLGNGAQTGNADGGNSVNPSGGGGGGPLAAEAACGSGQEPDSSGTCQNIASPPPVNAAPYQWMVDLAEALLAILTIFAVMVLVCKGKAWLEFVADYASLIIGILGGIICALGVAIMAMTGDKMIGGIFAAVGGFVCATAIFPSTLALGGDAAVNVAASALIGAAVGDLAAAGKGASAQ